MRGDLSVFAANEEAELCVGLLNATCAASDRRLFGKRCAQNWLATHERGEGCERKLERGYLYYML
jgi:hypothetical protein